MMKEMNKRDKTILVVIAIIVILVAGFFALIKPQYDKYVASLESYNTTKSEWDGIQQKINQIPALKETVTSLYNDANKDAAIFVNEAFSDVNGNYSDEKANVAVDEHIQAAIDESELEVRNFDLSGVASTTLEYYYYTPNVVTYSLLEAADVNGNYAADIAELLVNQVVLTERQVADVMTNEVTLDVVGTRENIMAFMEKIKDDPNAVLINNVSISDYTFSGGLEEETDAAPPVTEAPPAPEEGEEGAEGEGVEEPTEAPTEAPAQTPAAGGEQTLLADGYSEMSLTVTFYNAKAIDKPELGD